MLHFCGACAAAWREHGVGGAAFLRAAHQGGLPAIIAPDEAALFLRHALPHTSPGTPPAAEAALDLLRALLAPRPERRPRHALEISRLIDKARVACGGHGLAMRSAA
jgi:serine/threonine-protein kinase